jgi:hypothetical protein
MMTAYLDDDDHEASRGPPVTLLLPVVVMLPILRLDPISIRAPVVAPGS